MKRLLKDNIAPVDDPVMACQPDTAAKVDNSVHPAHFTVFCECKDWRSKWPEDRAWCQIADEEERFYANPYNFRHNGF
jgi:hypothetical protein